MNQADRPFVKDDLPVLVGQSASIEPPFEGVINAASYNVAIVGESNGSRRPHGYHPTVNLVPCLLGFLALLGRSPSTSTTLCRHYPKKAGGGSGVRSECETLFERHNIFLAAFKATPERLLHNDIQKIAESLGKYGLNLGHRIDLATFIECAKAFHQDNENNDDDDSDDDDDGGRCERSELLYRRFNSLSLQYGRDAWRCDELDQLKFIPRDTSRREGYDGINVGRYMRDDILSPGKITLAEYEPICWSQRGRVNPQPNPALCGTYGNLGKPTGQEIVRTVSSLLLSILSIINR